MGDEDCRGKRHPDEAVEGAGLLITVTPSSKPVSRCVEGKRRATIAAYHQYNMRRWIPAILTRASKIYFDSKEAVLSESGDILIPLEQGTIRRRTSRETLET